MADPLSIAASALAVAGAGGKLSQTLYIFIESVRKSEKQLRPVADFIKLTSAVLDNIGSLLGEKDVRDLCKDSLLGTTNQALEGCRQAFEELKNFVDGLLKTDANGKARLGPWDKFTFLPFRQRELDVLVSSLERFKGELDLVLKVLHLSVSIKNNKGVAEIQALKLQVEQLIKAKEAAEKAAAQNAVSATSEQPSDVTAGADAPAADNTTPAPAADGATMARSAPDMTARSLPVQDASSNVQDAASAVTAARSFMVMTASVPQPQSRTISAAAPLAAASNAKQRNDAPTQDQSALPAVASRSPDLHSPEDPRDLESNSDSEDELLRHLGRCADAVTKLSDEIERATRRWRDRRRYQRHGLTPAFETAHSAMKKLRKLEIDLEVSDGDGITSSSSPEGRHAMPYRRPLRRRDHEESERNWSAHKRLGKMQLADADGAGTASLTAVEEMKSRMRSRSRGRGIRSSSHSDSSDHWTTRGAGKYQSPRRRGGRIATSALPSSGVDAFLERHRSKSRSRDRSRRQSRTRTGVPIAAAGLGGAALAGLYEKHKASEELTAYDSETDNNLAFSNAAFPFYNSGTLDQPFGASNAARTTKRIDDLQSKRGDDDMKFTYPNKDDMYESAFRRPTQKFPDYSTVIREGVAPLPDITKDVTMGARCTCIHRRIVSPEALKEAEERFEKRRDCVIVLRVLTRDEILRLADRTVELRARRILVTEYNGDRPAHANLSDEDSPVASDRAGESGREEELGSKLEAAGDDGEASVNGFEEGKELTVGESDEELDLDLGVDDLVDGEDDALPHADKVAKVEARHKTDGSVGEFEIQGSSIRSDDTPMRSSLAVEETSIVVEGYDLNESGEAEELGDETTAVNDSSDNRRKASQDDEKAPSPGPPARARTLTLPYPDPPPPWRRPPSAEVQRSDIDVNEDYRRRMEQTQRELERESDELGLDPDPDRERRRREREQRGKEREDLAAANGEQNRDRTRRRHHHKRPERGSGGDGDFESAPLKKTGSSTSEFLGAGGGALIGDMIFPGLGTLGGAILGGVGGHEYGRVERRGFGVRADSRDRFGRSGYESFEGRIYRDTGYRRPGVHRRDSAPGAYPPPPPGAVPPSKSQMDLDTRPTETSAHTGRLDRSSLVEDYSALPPSDSGTHDFSAVDDLLKEWTTLATGEEKRSDPEDHVLAPVRRTIPMHRRREEQ